jgi:hypothetical protein
VRPKPYICRASPPWAKQPQLEKGNGHAETTRRTTGEKKNQIVDLKARPHTAYKQTKSARVGTCVARCKIDVEKIRETVPCKSRM